MRPSEVAKKCFDGATKFYFLQPNENLGCNIATSENSQIHTLEAFVFHKQIVFDALFHQVSSVHALFKHSLIYICWRGILDEGKRHLTFHIYTKYNAEMEE